MSTISTAASAHDHRSRDRDGRAHRPRSARRSTGAPRRSTRRSARASWRSPSRWPTAARKWSARWRSASTIASGTIDTRGTKLAETLHGQGRRDRQVARRARARDRRHARRRIGRFEELLVGRVETVAIQIEVRGLGRQRDRLAHGAVQPDDPRHAGEAERSLGQLAASTVEAIRTTAQEAERRSPAPRPGVTARSSRTPARSSGC